MARNRLATRARNVPAPTLEEEKAILLELADKEDGSEYDLGVHFNILVDSRLWKQGPYKSASDFIRKVIKAVSTSEIWLYGSIARHFSREVAVRSGMSKLATLMTYAALIRQELPSDPANFVILVPRKDGGTVRKKFAECTRAELRAAIKRARGGDDEKIPPEDKREVDSLRNTFRNATGLNSPARFDAVYRNGMTLVSLEHMPVHVVWQICQALGHPPRPPPEPEVRRRSARRRAG